MSLKCQRMQIPYLKTFRKHFILPLITSGKNFNISLDILTEPILASLVKAQCAFNTTDNSLATIF